MRGAAADAFDEATCEALLLRVSSTEDAAWGELVALLWPELLSFIRKNRAMAPIARSADHVHNVAVLVLEKLGTDGCRGAQLYAPWRDTHPDKTVRDWLRIVTVNGMRDYLRVANGRSDGRAALQRRLLHSLATLVPDSDDLPVAESLSATSRHAARELASWADARLPAQQSAALEAWLAGAGFEEIAESLGLGGGPAAKRVVRAALASLRRRAAAA